MSAKDIRNIVLLGHSGSGKTTLAESMLYLTGGTDRLGRIADGNTVCDYDPEEIRRQISISLAVAPVEYDSCKINVLDVPGGFDFAGEVAEAVQAADAAVIVCSAKAGMSVGAEKAWKYCEKNSLPRLLYISNSNDVQISGVRLMNSPFWTTHIYRCNNIKLLNLHIFAPAAPVKAPSSDAIDIDVCSNVLVKNCYMSVNDDAVALKGGKGPWADKDANNGSNTNIIIEDCTYGFCHSGLTCGSESIHNRNIILRRCKISNATRLLWLKMRPDTPQHYEYILVEDITGDAKSMLLIKPWTQFFDLKGRKDIPLSRANNVTLRNINLSCYIFFNVSKSDQYELKDFTFENLNIKAKDAKCDKEIISNFEWKNVKVNQ